MKTRKNAQLPFHQDPSIIYIWTDIWLQPQSADPHFTQLLRDCWHYFLPLKYRLLGAVVVFFCHHFFFLFLLVPYRWRFCEGRGYDGRCYVSRKDRVLFIEPHFASTNVRAPTLYRTCFRFPTTCWLAGLGSGVHHQVVMQVTACPANTLRCSVCTVRLLFGVLVCLSGCVWVMVGEVWFISFKHSVKRFDRWLSNYRSKAVWWSPLCKVTIFQVDPLYVCLFNNRARCEIDRD